MSRSRKKDFSRLFPDSQRLVFLSMEKRRAVSRPERLFWENELSKVILRLLKAKKQEKLDAAIEYLYQADLETYNILLEMIEAYSESSVVQYEGEKHDVLLVVAPVLAWTRFVIPSGPLPSPLHDGLLSSLAESIFTENARIILAPELYAIDQLPQSHTEVFSLMSDMVASFSGSHRPFSFRPQETTPFFADVRYLVMSVQVPVSGPLFRWQVASRVSEHDTLRQECLENWKKKALPLLSDMMHGCMLELILPDAFFDACRKADQQIRPPSIHAAADYLAHVMDVSAADLSAVIAGFIEWPEQEFITEYRIGFSLHDNPQVLYGVVWPVYGAEEMQQTLKQHASPDAQFTEENENQGPLSRILALLHACGITRSKFHQERFPLEFCDECDVPLFADINGELVHAELPESAGQTLQLH